MKKASLYAAQFALGGLTYCGFEVVYRGYTHRSMLAAGGLCFVLLCLLARSHIGLFSGALAGGLVITAVEFVAGAIVNLWLGLGVWDYSHRPFNLLGQVCLRFSLIWCLLSGLVILFARIIRGAALLYWERAVKRAVSAQRSPVSSQTGRKRI
ncbi:MAG: putative ABC transporter permease [Oscillospiraceae bacterium]|jgi:uncharacterized membrane protein|nr:putative ABC transporter permease [Oscillospiraceae bacterium]